MSLIGYISKEENWDQKHQDLSDSFRLSKRIKEDLSWWLEPNRLNQGLSLQLSSPRLVLFTDASELGWGATLGLREVSGTWSGEQVSWHQQEGTSSSASSSRSLRTSSLGLRVARKLGQHDSSSLHQEAGRDPLILPFRESKGAPSLDRGTENNSPNQIYPRGKERKSRPFEQKGSGPSHGMDAAFRSMQQDLEPLGETQYRPLRNALECETGEILLTNIRSKGRGSRRSPSKLGGDRRVRFSSFQDPRRGSKKVRLFGGSKTDPHRSILASTRLVHRGTGMDDRFPEVPSTAERSSQTAPLRQIPQKPPRSRSDCLQTVEGLVRARGFSRNAANAIARARRPSTLRVYQSKWEVFRRWTRAQKVSSSSTSVTEIADFLLYLREKCNLAVTTIKGYKSMLSSVFRHRGLNILENKDLHDLIRSFETSKSKTIRPPSWNLDVVLKYLMSEKFEPPHTSSFRDLTRKSLFLFALASAKRVSELQALEGTVGFKEDSAVCSFNPLFLAKNENPSKPWPRTFEIKGLSSLVGRDVERTLCPVRILKFYLERKKLLGGNVDSFWCSVRNPKRAISKNAQAFFIRDVIREAHASCEEEHFRLLRVKAHEVRAVATSLAFHRNMSLQALVESTYWRCNSVFTSSYLRDVRVTYDKCFSLRPYVSADSLLGQGAETNPL
ncbi:uncharacterized protein LOC135218072 [Macrobrachium nipponense]|uniref:uncharacterized protein LOC135218072 n=1 Tax=Macrobrachium nipponense TaxID=159736 RepID=UPI0030C84A2B